MFLRCDGVGLEFDPGTTFGAAKNTNVIALERIDLTTENTESTDFAKTFPPVPERRIFSFPKTRKVALRAAVSTQ